MKDICSILQDLQNELQPYQATLVAVSKTKPIDLLMEAYQCGQRIFGENYVQELLEKKDAMPFDVVWHFIGHLQTNKVKYIAPFVTMVHGVDSIHLLDTIHKAAVKLQRPIHCLLQMFIASEDTKFGLDIGELEKIVSTKHNYHHIRFSGMMGMATQTDNVLQIEREYKLLKTVFDDIAPSFDENFKTLSMGMTNDYKIALACGSNMVRIGSMIFGARNYNIG